MTDATKKSCGFEWTTGVATRVQHRCPLDAGHEGKHTCSKPCKATKGEDTPAQGVPTVVEDEPSMVDTHVPSPLTRPFGITLALCGARQQTVLGKTKGCRFAVAPEAATCPRCKAKQGDSNGK